MTPSDVKIVIPVYRNTLNKFEQLSLRRCLNVLGEYPIVIVKPESLDFSYWTNLYPQCAVESFSDDYFTSIVAYNRLMLSTEFYERFTNVKYILIYQLDAYVFADKLVQWVNKGYDYIGAPWLLKKKYHRWYYQLFLRLKTLSYKLQGKPFSTTIVGDKVGNGGLSLRKVASHIQILRKKAEKAHYFLQQSKRFASFNEDVFWATQSTFRYPDYKEAALFSIESQPELAYEYTGGKNPFGCHGWSKERNLPFWRTKIDIDE